MPKNPRPVQPKGGKRADLDNQYFRSAWEANYARYLNFLKHNKKILDWEYETIEFEFPVKRGPAKFYKIDFAVIELDGNRSLIEIKGYWDAVSKTKLKRMAKYFPDVKIQIVSKKEYNAIKQWSKLIPGWE